MATEARQPDLATEARQPILAGRREKELEDELRAGRVTAAELKEARAEAAQARAALGEVREGASPACMHAAGETNQRQEGKCLSPASPIPPLGEVRAALSCMPRASHTVICLSAAITDTATALGSHRE
jgi:hypothetical protein